MFQKTASRIGGVNFDIIAKETLERHRLAYTSRSGDNHILRNPGFYHWRAGGEAHINDPLNVSNLQVGEIIINSFTGTGSYLNYFLYQFAIFLFYIIINTINY